MPLITDYKQVLEEYRKAAEKKISLPVFCSEDRETLEAILASALEYGEEIGVNDLPIIPAWTSRYPARGQMQLITANGNPVLGTKLMFSDLNVFMDEASPYRFLKVMPHLDHAFPWLDGDILDGFVEQFASVMHDASEKPFEENIKLTSEFVEKVKGRVVVEGAVDEIIENNKEGIKNELTTPEQALRFLQKTGVDIIVPNVGTEHRATTDKVQYNSDQARKIQKKVGNIMCLHGTSSVEPGKLLLLYDDGFIKINIYTTLAVYGGQAIGRKVLKNLGNIFTEKQLKDFVDKGILTNKVLDISYGETITPIKPKLSCLANPQRRDTWFLAVKERCKDFLKVFNYDRFADIR